MTINERFDKVIKELYKGNKRAFAITVGVAPTVIENIVGTRKGNPSFEVLYKTLYANANISAEWLILEIGEMIKLKEEHSNDIEYIIGRIEFLSGENAVLIHENERLRALLKPKYGDSFGDVVMASEL